MKFYLQLSSLSLASWGSSASLAISPSFLIIGNDKLGGVTMPTASAGARQLSSAATAHNRMLPAFQNEYLSYLQQFLPM